MLKLKIFSFSNNHNHNALAERQRELFNSLLDDWYDWDMKSRLDIVGGITWMMWLINHPESSKLIRKGRAYAGIYKARLDKNRKKILALLSELNFNNPNLADSVFTLIQISMMRSTLDNGNRARKELLKCCIEYNEILCDLLVDENISFHPQVYKSISSLTKSKDEVVIRK